MFKARFEQEHLSRTFGKAQALICSRRADTLCYDKGSEAITERGRCGRGTFFRRRHGVGNEHEEKREINEAYPDMADIS